MKNSVAAIIIVLLWTAVSIDGPLARDAQSGVGLNAVRSQGRTPAVLRLPNDPVWLDIPWPTRWAALQTGKINASFGDNATFGLPFGDFQIDYPFFPRTSFEFPPGSGHNYLYGASIWVGGVLDGDTIVSTGDDGWFNTHEFYPDSYSPNAAGSIRPEALTSTPTLRSDCTDTLQPSVPAIAPSEGGPHLPLHITLVNRARVWTDPPFNNCLIYDLTVTNVGTHTIHGGYVGVYVDGDVYGPGSAMRGASDDIAGSVRNKGIAYIIDNDGDPQNGKFDPVSSPTGMLSFKFLASSFQPTDSSFNWWLTQSSGRGIQDFGPQKQAHSRQFGLGGSGQPVSDEERYLLLSGREWDYDQVQIAAIADQDSSWVPPPDSAIPRCQGADVRFLMSLGPFELAPDSSVRVMYTFFAADSVQTDPHILDFLPIAPDLYTLSLDFKSVLENASAADSLARIVLNPSNLPTGLRVQGFGSDSARISWDPWCFGNIDGFNLYAAAIPDSAYLHRGVIPPWFRPSPSDLFAQLGLVKRASLSGLAKDKAYAVSLATRFGIQVGNWSQAEFFRSGPGPDAPLLLDSMIFPDRSGAANIRWSLVPGATPDHFNIYRFPDSGSAVQKYPSHYSLFRELHPIVDSVVRDQATYFYYAMPVSATVSGNAAGYVDSAASDGNVYVVTAVDSSGFESAFSAPVTFVKPVRTKDILVITNSNPSGSFVSFSSIASYYSNVLKGYSVDFYSLVDSLQAKNCPLFSPTCFDWHDLMRYRLVIVDDGLSDGVLDYSLELATGAFSKYLLSGGQLAYFGSFARMRPVPLPVDSRPGFFPAGSSFVTRFFGIDSVFYVGPYYFGATSTPPYVDSLFAFRRAEGASADIPSISADTAHAPFSFRFRSYWPAATVPSVSTFKVNSHGLTTHLFRSSRPSTSLNEGQPVGVITNSDTTRTYAFGFHLWYMNASDAQLLINWITGLALGRPNDSVLPQATGQSALSQNFPNPFNPSTRISFDLPQAGSVLLEIYNILGQRVRTLVDETRQAGHHEVLWDGRDASGADLASGLYLYRLKTESVTLSRKMLLLR